VDDIDLIRDFQSDFRGPDENETAWAKDALMERVAGAQSRRTKPATSRQRLPRRRWLIGAAAAAVIVALAVIVPALVSNGPLGGVQSAAAAALSKAAGVAANQQTASAPTAGQFVYTKTKADYQSGTYGAGPKHDQNFSVLTPEVREAWIGTDGSGRLLETHGTPTFLTARDRAAWIAADRPSLGAGKTYDEAYGKGGLSYLDLTKMPTDQAQLRTMIEQRKVEGGPPGDAETFTIIGDLLRETYAPPALRAALYRIASELPGVELIGTVNDETGRTGTAVGYTTNGIRQELIFDPGTSALLGERSVIVDPAKAKIDVPAGTVVGWAAYLASGVVNSTSERP
jgi:hypothetical protein